MNRKLFASFLLLLLTIGGIVFAMQRTASHARDTTKLQVVATTYPLYEFARHVGGDKTQVINMTPAGAEPHDYEPSPKSLLKARKAAVFIYNGGQLEPWVENFLPEYAHTVVRASQGIPLLHAETDGQDHEHTHEHTGKPEEPTKIVQDPHFWLDPVLAQKIVDTIYDGLVRADSANKDYYARNAERYKNSLAKLDGDYRSGLASCLQRTVISSHDAFSYLAKRYGFEVVGVAGISTEEEPSAGKIAELSQLARSKGIQYIFFESLVNPRLADTIATETGAKTLLFDPIEGLTDEAQKQGKNYLSIQRTNLANLRTALACR